MTLACCCQQLPPSNSCVTFSPLLEILLDEAGSQDNNVPCFFILPRPTAQICHLLPFEEQGGGSSCPSTFTQCSSSSAARLLDCLLPGREITQISNQKVVMEKTFRSTFKTEVQRCDIMPLQPKSLLPRFQLLNPFQHASTLLMMTIFPTLPFPAWAIPFNPFHLTPSSLDHSSFPTNQFLFFISILLPILLC